MLSLLQKSCKNSIVNSMVEIATLLGNQLRKALGLRFFSKVLSTKFYIICHRYSTRVFILWLECRN